jgi:hypothetical protein
MSWETKIADKLADMDRRAERLWRDARLFPPAKAPHQPDAPEFAVALSETAKRMGLDLAQPEQRRAAALFVTKDTPSAVPLYGGAAKEADRLGGRARFERVKQILGERKLRADLNVDYEYAVREMFREVREAHPGWSLRDAVTFSEALPP